LWLVLHLWLLLLPKRWLTVRWLTIRLLSVCLLAECLLAVCLLSVCLLSVRLLSVTLLLAERVGTPLLRRGLHRVGEEWVCVCGQRLW